MSFDYSDAQSSSFDVLPPGKYPVSLTMGGIKDSKSGGKYFNLRFSVLEGEFKGRTLFHMITLENNNPKAVQIGRGQMKDMLLAMGFEKPAFSSVADLEGHKVMATVAVKKEVGFEDKNAIKKFEKYTASESTQAPF